MKLQRFVPFAFLFVALTRALPAPVYGSPDSDLAVRDESDLLDFEARGLQASSKVKASHKASHNVANSAAHKAAHKASKMAQNVQKAQNAYHQTTNLPGKHEIFQVPGGPTYTGDDVHKAVLNAHVEKFTKRPRKPGQPKSPLVKFRNDDHRDPHPDKPHDTKPMNHMIGPGIEYPLGDPVHKGPARVIMQKTASGHEFKGVVAHDMTRKEGEKGRYDHFQITPTSGSTSGTGH